MKKYIIGTVIFGVLCLCGYYSFFHEKQKEHVILYSWSMSALDEKKEHLLEVIEDRKITDLYQEVSSNFLNQRSDQFLKDLKEVGVETYYLTGHPEWAYENDAVSIKKEIDKVFTFNQAVDTKFKGIVFDIEPYHDLEEGEFDQKMLKSYTKAIQMGYQYAKEKDLLFVICIPTWYEKVDPDLLKEIISSADRIEVMNYVVADTLPNIKTEIDYAKSFDKEITSIYQVDFNYDISKDEEKDGIFYSYREMNLNFTKMKKTYTYSKLWIGYHYFDEM